MSGSRGDGVTYLDATGRGTRPGTLLLRGMIALVLIGAVVSLLIARYQGVMTPTTRVTAIISGVGDGLPPDADVRFRGMVVGKVSGVSLVDDQRSSVAMELDPSRAESIPGSVTARVVPSNIFAVSAIELVGPASGSGGHLTDRTEIAQDTSQQTLALQTAMNSIRTVLAAIDPARLAETMSVISGALSGRGAGLGSAMAHLTDYLAHIHAATDDAGGDLRALDSAIGGLRRVAPELVSTLTKSLRPARTLATRSESLTDFLTSATGAVNRVDGVLTPANVTGGIRLITGLDATIGAVAATADTIPAAFDALNRGASVLGRAFTGTNGRLFFDIDVSFTPFTPYGAADCPRYGSMSGPSCRTAPRASGRGSLPDALRPRSLSDTSFVSAVGGNVGGVGSAAEQRILTAFLGRPADTVTGILLDPLLRGKSITVGTGRSGGGR